MADSGGAGSALHRTVVVLVVVVAVVVGVVVSWAVRTPDQSTTASALATASSGATKPGPNPGGTTRTSTGPYAGDPLTLVGLGDSVPAATTCGCTGYVELLGQSLRRATGRPVVVHNDSTDGATTADVEQDVRVGQTAADLSHADLVTVEIGANDFDLDGVNDPACLPVLSSPCWTDTLTRLSAGLTDIVTEVRTIDTAPDVRIALIGYWNVTVDGDVGAAHGGAFVSGSDALTRAVNATIAAVAISSHAVYIDAYSPLKGTGSLDPTSALLDDGDHLSAEGHVIMEKALFESLQAAGVVSALTPAP